jgi:hypothetical protein
MDYLLRWSRARGIAARAPRLRYWPTAAPAATARARPRPEFPDSPTSRRCCGRPLGRRAPREPLVAGASRVSRCRGAAFPARTGTTRSARCKGTNRAIPSGRQPNATAERVSTVRSCESRTRVGIADRRRPLGAGVLVAAGTVPLAVALLAVVVAAVVAVQVQLAMDAPGMGIGVLLAAARGGPAHLVAGRAEVVPPCRGGVAEESPLSARQMLLQAVDKARWWMRLAHDR